MDIAALVELESVVQFSDAGFNAQSAVTMNSIPSLDQSVVKHRQLVQLAYVMGAALMLFAVALGAFGSHMFGPELRANGNLHVFNTANQYHFIHALALLIIAGMGERIRLGMLSVVVYAMLLGVILFSGSLYLLALFDIKALGIITPIGGVSLLLAWLGLVASQLQRSL